MNREEQIEKARELLACGVLSKEACDAIKNDFPELAESEDERMRKFLIDILNHGTWKKEWPFSPPECISWLEKQKEQKSCSKDGIPLLDYYQGIMEGRSDVIDHPEQFGLCKPAEWSEEKEKAVDDYATEIIKWEDAHKDWDREAIRATAYHFFNYGLYNFLSPQPKQEWSEKDKEMIQFYLDESEYRHDDWPNKDRVEMLEKFRDWLKSLHPQPKNEWSKKDYILMQDLIDLLWIIQGGSNIKPGTASKYEQWLKSLHPQPSWKPSEEQMEALEWVVDAYMDRQTGSMESWKKAGALKELLEQLKVL